MFAVVVPARDEAGRIGPALSRVLRLPVDLVIPVVNGCTDTTLDEVQAIPDRRVRPLLYSEALGLDVGRAAGARVARGSGATGVLFMDGDMMGELEAPLRLLISSVKSGRFDMALCYVRRPPAQRPDSMASRVTALRLELNRALGLPGLGDAIACHGPHAVSRRLLDQVPLRELAVPPVAQALAARAGLRLGVAAALSHADLQHRARPAEHRARVGETMIGDILEALCVTRGEARHRVRDGREYSGGHGERRFDLLDLEIQEGERSCAP